MSSKRAMSAVALLAALVLSACDTPAAGPRTEQTPDVPPATVHNAADVAFAQHMIPHHQQALDMADMVPTHTTNATLQTVAIHIKTDQQAEIVTLEGFLARWNEPRHNHGDHGSMSMDGMVDSETMARLPSLTGSDFDTLWITSMIGHHQGAVEMAQDEIAHGQNPDAIKTAQIIVVSQEREIAFMRDIRASSE
jgi:uncharacterized protein (DUF305 family)